MISIDSFLTENADAFHDRQDRRFGIHTLNEVAVQLNAVQRVIHDMAERGVTGAEVVQRDADAHFLEHLQRAQHVFRTVLVERVFGHLQFDQVVGECGTSAGAAGKFRRSCRVKNSIGDTFSEMGCTATPAARQRAISAKTFSCMASLILVASS